MAGCFLIKKKYVCACIEYVFTEKKRDVAKEQNFT
jgi:hypothetical protein